MNRLENIQLRDYQKQGIADIDSYLESGKTRILRQAFTGTGKSVEQFFLTVRHLEQDPKNVVYLLVPFEELVENLARYFLANGIQCSYIFAGRFTLWSSRVYICTIGTLKNRLENLKINPSLIIADECHHSPSNTWTKCFNHFPSVPKIGFTATPLRLDGKGFEELFDVMVTSEKYQYYIDNSYLSPYKVGYPDTIYRKDFKKISGDYSLSEQQDFYDDPVIIGDAVRTWEKYTKGLKTIVFCSGIEHSKRVSQEYNQYGQLEFGKDISKHLDGDTDKKIRREVFKRFKLPVDHSESLLVLTNVSLFIEGVDVPEASVTQWLRLTASESLYDQGNGRSNRYFPGKTQWILDQVGNVEKHGTPCRERVYSLLSRKKKKEQELEEYNLICLNCKTLVHPDYRELRLKKKFKPPNNFIECPGCHNYVLIPFEDSDGRGVSKDPEVVDGELKILRQEDIHKLNLFARFRKYSKYSVNNFFKHVTEDFPSMSLEDLKIACEYKQVSEAYAYSIWSQKFRKIS